MLGRALDTPAKTILLVARRGLLVTLLLVVVAGCLPKTQTTKTTSPSAKSEATTTTTTTAAAVSHRAVPQVVGLPLIMAKLRLGEAGFATSVPGLHYGGNDREVLEQEPAGGTEVASDSTTVVSLLLAETTYTYASTSSSSSSSASSSSTSASVDVPSDSGISLVIPSDPQADPTTTIVPSETTTTIVTDYVYVSYTSDALGFTVEHPDSWLTGSFSMDSFSMEFFTNVSMSGVGNNISIMAEDVPAATDLDDYFAEAEGQVEALGGSIENKTAIKLGGVDAYQYDLPEIASYKQTQVVAVNSSKAWIITYSAASSTYSSDLQVLDHMIDTFRFPASV